MPDVAPRPLDYERLRRLPRRRIVDRIIDAFAISLALLWPIWAFFVTRYCTAHAAAMTSTGTLLIAATIALPIGFGVIACCGTGFQPVSRQRRHVEDTG